MAEISKEKEYEGIRRQVEGQFSLIVQVFVASVIASVALFGYGFQTLARKEDSVSGLAPFLVLAPLAITIPCAYFIASLRREIFKWGTYIQTFLEDGRNLRYETELARYREKYKETESLSPIALTYWGLFLIFASSFGWGLHTSSSSLWWLFVLVLPVCLLLHWNCRYNAIPTKDRGKMEERWRTIKNQPTNSPPSVLKKGEDNEKD
jgi:hypothetical protein